MSGITCPSCRTVAPPGAIFCDHCGYDLRTVMPATPPQPEPAPAPAAASAEIVCSLCGHHNIAGSAFCENCGKQLTPPQPAAAPATPPPAAAPAPAPVPPAPPPAAAMVTGRLVVQSTGVSIPVPAGKALVVIGREDPVSSIFPDIDLDPYGGHESGVGRRHAQLVAQPGGTSLEDLDSVNGTFVNKQKLAPRQPRLLENGDEIRMGKLVLVYFSR